MTRVRRVRKAVIPAAGLGTRFLPASKAVPKEMLPIVDKPVIQYIIEGAVASGILTSGVLSDPEQPRHRPGNPGPHPETVGPALVQPPAIFGNL